MTQLWNAVRYVKIWNDSRGQDLVEYALAAGFIVVAGAAFSPEISASIGTVFGKVVAALQSSGGGTQAAPTN